MHITERTVARLYERYRRVCTSKEKLRIFKQFQNAENVVFGRHLSEGELNEKVTEWKRKGFI